LGLQHYAILTTSNWYQYLIISTLPGSTYNSLMATIPSKPEIASWSVDPQVCGAKMPSKDWTSSFTHPQTALDWRSISPLLSALQHQYLHHLLFILPCLAMVSSSLQNILANYP